METAGKSALIQGFMTHRMTDADVMALATGREEPTGLVMDAVQRSRKAAPGALQHVVIYGPRGFGKSFMTRLVQIETTRLSTRVRPVRFVLLPEEQHNLTRNPHALLDYIAAKIADLRTGQDRSWEDSMFRWPDPAREAALWEQAVRTLEDELDHTFGGASGLAVVVVENFDMMLATLFKEKTAEERLRAWLDRPGNRVMLIATATGTVDYDYERPLFQAFQPVRLQPWSQDDCIAYFDKHRQLDGKPPLEPAMEAKARAIADFIGGNPRLAKLLAEVLESQNALTVAQTMNALADKLADYYRRRIDDLPPLAQGLLDALIRGGEPASQTSLAQRVGAGGQSTIARVMQDLQRGDIVRGQQAPDGREILYRVIDRVFVHFYRLRQGNQAAQAALLTTILDFLRAFYSRDEQRVQAARHLDAGQSAEARVFADLALEDDQRAARRNEYRSGFVSRLEWLAQMEPRLLLAPLDEIATLADEHPELLPERFGRAADDDGHLVGVVRILANAQARARLGLPLVADVLLLEGVNGAGPIGRVVLLLERYLLREWELEDHPGALEVASVLPRGVNEAMPAALRARALRHASWSLGQLGQHEEAVATAQEAARAASEIGDGRERAMALRNAAWSLGKLNRFEEAVIAARASATLAAEATDARERIIALQHAAWSLGRLGRFEEAVTTARESAGLAAEVGLLEEQAKSLRIAAWSLGELGQHEKAVTTAQEAAGLASEIGVTGERAESLRIAAWSLGQLGLHEQAVTTAEESAALAAGIRNTLGQIIALRIAARSLAAIGRYAGAATTIVEAAELSANVGDMDQRAATLRDGSWLLGQSGQHEQAAKMAQEAAGLAFEIGEVRVRATALRNAAWSLGQLGRHEEAVRAARTSAELAADIGAVKERTIALRHAAWSLSLLGREAEAYSLATESFELSAQRADDWNADKAARIALKAACRVVEPEAVRLFGRWMARDVNRDDDHSDRGLDSWRFWVDELFGAAARARAWDSLDALLNAKRRRFSERQLVFEGRSTGLAIARAGSDEGRAAGFEAARGILNRIVELHGGLSDGMVPPQWLSGLASSFAAECRDPGLIRDVVGLLKTLGPYGDKQAALLTALAAVDDAQDPEAVLARMDPDVALWIRRVRDLAEPEPKPRERKDRR